MKTSVRIMIVTVALLWPLAAFAQQQVVARVGSLSPQRAFAESAEGKAGIARLQALEEKQSREIAAKNKALQSQQQAFEQNVPCSPPTPAHVRAARLNGSASTSSGSSRKHRVNLSIDITTDVVKQLALARAAAKVAGDPMYDAERQPPA